MNEYTRHIFKNDFYHCQWDNLTHKMSNYHRQKQSMIKNSMFVKEMISDKNNSH